MKRAASITISLVWSLISPAQQQFQEYISDAANPSNFVAWQMNTTSDSGFIFNGLTDFTDAYLMKSDQVGNIQWLKNYTGLDNIYTVEQVADDGYIMLGKGDTDQAVLMKTDASGNIQWAKKRSGIAWPGGCVHELPTGGYIFAGIFFQSQLKVFLCRTDTAGNVLWEKAYNIGVAVYTSNFLQLTPDGGFIVCGGLPSAGGIGLVKMDGAGNIQWQKSLFPGELGGNTIHVTPSGYFISGAGGVYHAAILTDSSGNVIWAQGWQRLTNSSFYEDPFKVVANGDQLICYGVRFLSLTQRSNLIFRFDTLGNILWSNYYGTFPAATAVDIVESRATPGNGLAFMALNFNAEVFIMSMDSSMTPNCNDSAANFFPTPLPVTYGTSAVVATPLFTTYTNVTYPVVTRVTSTYYNCTPLGNDDNMQDANIRLYPNPANNKAVLEFSSAMEGDGIVILDVSGRTVCTIELNRNSEKAEINVEDLAPGLYLWKYETDGKVITGKFLVQH
jgi:hypothetical protein